MKLSKKVKSFIISLSEMQGDTSINNVMAYPWPCGELEGRRHNHIGLGYVCHHDDGYLCKCRAKWIIKYIESNS